MPGGSAGGSSPTYYESLITSAARGDAGTARYNADKLRMELEDKLEFRVAYDAKKGQIQLREGVYEAIDRQSLDRFLEEVIEEAERIEVVLKEREDAAYSTMWQEFFEKWESEVPPYSREAMYEYARNGKLSEIFGVTMRTVGRKTLGDLYHDNAEYHIRRGDVDWHAAWKYFNWHEVFEKMHPGTDLNGGALDMIDIARARDDTHISDAIMKQYFADRLALYKLVQSEDTWVDSIARETVSPSPGRANDGR